jgi:integrase
MEQSVSAAARAAWVDRIRPTKKRRELPDRSAGKVTGLYLIVQPSGAKSWALRYRLAGKARKLTIGTCAAFTLGQAREQARSALNMVARGHDPIAAKQQRDEEQASFEAVARAFIDRYAIGPKGRGAPRNRSWHQQARLLGLRPSKEGDLVVIKGGLVDSWAKRRLGGIRRDEIVALLDDIADRAPIQANRTFSCLHAMFAWALGRYRLAENPCKGVDPPAKERPRDRVLSDAELRAVWKAAGEIGWPFGPIVRLLILTGQRRAEVAGMEWSEIDLERKVWTLPRGRVKNDEGHTVPLSSAAIEIIEQLPRKGKQPRLVFCTMRMRGKAPTPRPPSGFHRAKDRLDALSGVEQWRIHDIRRSVASGMAGLKVALPVIEKVMNHSSGSFRGIVGVYQRHTFADEKREALEAWARKVVEEIVDGRPANVTRLADVRRAV